eukprot:SAG11_NODE_418_length_9653_cov_2.465564_1_plen_93_part_00
MQRKVVYISYKFGLVAHRFSAVYASLYDSDLSGFAVVAAATSSPEHIFIYSSRAHISATNSYSTPENFVNIHSSVLRRPVDETKHRRKVTRM